MNMKDRWDPALLSLPVIVIQLLVAFAFPYRQGNYEVFIWTIFIILAASIVIWFTDDFADLSRRRTPDLLDVLDLRDEKKSDPVQRSLVNLAFRWSALTALIVLPIQLIFFPDNNLVQTLMALI